MLKSSFWPGTVPNQVIALCNLHHCTIVMSGDVFPVPHLPQGQYSQESHRKCLSLHLQTCSPCTSQSQQFWCAPHCPGGHCPASSLCGGREERNFFKVWSTQVILAGYSHYTCSLPLCLHAGNTKEGWGINEELLSWASASFFCISCLPALIYLLERTKNHGITEWFDLEGTLKIPQFQSPATGKDTSH